MKSGALVVCSVVLLRCLCAGIVYMLCIVLLCCEIGSRASHCVLGTILIT